MSQSTKKLMSTLALTSSCIAYIGNWIHSKEHNYHNVDRNFLEEITKKSDSILEDLLHLKDSWPCTIDNNVKKEVTKRLITFEESFTQKVPNYRPAVLLSVTSSMIVDLRHNIKSNRKVLLDEIINKLTDLYSMFRQEDFEKEIIIKESEIFLDEWNKINK